MAQVINSGSLLAFNLVQLLSEVLLGFLIVDLHHFELVGLISQLLFEILDVRLDLLEVLLSL